MLSVELIKTLGPLRSALALLALLLIAMTPVANFDADIGLWNLMRNAVAPALTVIVGFVLLLDLMMCRIFMLDADSSTIGQYRRIMRVDRWLVVLLWLTWAPIIAIRLGYLTW